MTAGQRVKIKRYPKLTGTITVGSYRRYFSGFPWESPFTAPELRVDVAWDEALGTPDKTTIREDLLEVVV